MSKPLSLQTDSSIDKQSDPWRESVAWKRSVWRWGGGLYRRSLRIAHRDRKSFICRKLGYEGLSVITNAKRSKARQYLKFVLTCAAETTNRLAQQRHGT
eukprot:4083284-Amphidinium_carterae.1